MKMKLLASVMSLAMIAGFNPAFAQQGAGGGQDQQQPGQHGGQGGGGARPAQPNRMGQPGMAPGGHGQPGMRAQAQPGGEGGQPGQGGGQPGHGGQRPRGAAGQPGMAPGGQGQPGMRAQGQPDTGAPQGHRGPRAAEGQPGMAPGGHGQPGMHGGGGHGQGGEGQRVGGRGGHGPMTAEQRGRFIPMFRQGGIRPIERHDFALEVGRRAPRDLRLYALPPEIIVEYPGWRHYQYVLVDDDILVINPRTYEIVAVLPA